MTDSSAGPVAYAVPSQIVVRLTRAERDALAQLLHGMTVPHRQRPTVSEAVRVAIATTAKAISSAP